jgi:hypothetical protein
MESDKLERRRVPHAVPLGGIFIWSMEGLILSFMLGVASLQNTILRPFYLIMIVSYCITNLSHLVVATVYNQPKDALTVGSLHASISNVQCTVVFTAVTTYVSLCLDSCLKDGSDTTCSQVFPEFPMAYISVPCTCILTGVILLTSIALGNVSCPSTSKCYLFVSKTGVAVAICFQALAVPAMVSRLGTCGSSLDVAEGFWVFYLVVSLILGVVSDALELLFSSGSWMLLLSEIAHVALCTIIPVTAVSIHQHFTWGIILASIVCVMCVWIPFVSNRFSNTRVHPLSEEEEEEEKGKGSQNTKILEVDLLPPKQVTFMSDNHTKSYSIKKKLDGDGATHNHPKERELSDIFATDAVRDSILRNRTTTNTKD